MITLADQLTTAVDDEVGQAGGGGGEGRLTTQWLAALRVKIFKAVVFEVFMAVVLSGCQCWSPRGGRREEGAAGTLLFEAVFRATGRPVLMLV